MGGALPIELWRHIISSFACRTQSRCIWNFRGRMLRYLRRPLTGYAVGIPGRAQTCSLRFWRPLLHHLSYGNIKRRPWNRTSRVYTRTALHIALRRPYKTALVLRQGCCLTHIPSGSLPTPSGIQSFLSWHGRLSVQLCGG